VKNHKNFIDIKTLIPQQPPFIMIDELLFCDDERTKTLFTIKCDNVFLEPLSNCVQQQNQTDVAFSQSGIIENIAQTCAARMGYLGNRQKVKIGMIASINNFEIFYLPKINDQIITEIVVETEIGNVVLLNTTVVCNEKIIATGKMKVVLTDIELKN
jgi:predicted hotdog family 3-hydroxylacyl-ACP dehydratase